MCIRDSQHGACSRSVCGPAALKSCASERNRLKFFHLLKCERFKILAQVQFRESFSRKPALHRFPGSMGKRAHALCEHLVEHHHGDAADVWEGATDAQDLSARVNALPGFGEEKSMIFIALLGKRFGRAPEGWESVAGPFADDQPRSVADIGSEADLLDVRAWKKAKKAAGKAKTD